MSYGHGFPIGDHYKPQGDPNVHSYRSFKKANSDSSSCRNFPKPGDPQYEHQNATIRIIGTLKWYPCLKKSPKP